MCVCVLGSDKSNQFIDGELHNEVRCAAVEDESDSLCFDSL